ncbi:hypothetical protein IID24_05015 [Patescibacteria group bacterium]|nr:hypothetical protein [Patescibacteria group bacterium]
MTLVLERAKVHSILRRNPAVSLRSRISDKFLPGYSKALRQVLLDFGFEVVQFIEVGIYPFMPDILDLFHTNLLRVQSIWIPNMVQQGFALADDELDFREEQGKALNDPVIVGVLDPIPGEFEFLLNADFTRIDSWVKTTAKGSTKTGAAKLRKIFEDAASTPITVTRPDGTTFVKGLTVKDIAKKVSAQWKTVTPAYADMIARTGTIWAYNEGALQRYMSIGVTVVEWFTTSDDRTCEWCLQMDRIKVRSGDSFAHAGDSIPAGFVLADGSEVLRNLNIQINVEHPPLHPRCRCVLLPIVETVNIQIVPQPVIRPRRIPKLTRIPKPKPLILRDEVTRRRPGLFDEDQKPKRKKKPKRSGIKEVRKTPVTPPKVSTVESVSGTKAARFREDLIAKAEAPVQSIKQIDFTKLNEEWLALSTKLDGMVEKGIGINDPKVFKIQTRMKAIETERRLKRAAARREAGGSFTQEDQWKLLKEKKDKHVTFEIPDAKNNADARIKRNMDSAMTEVASWIPDKVLKNRASGLKKVAIDDMFFSSETAIGQGGSYNVGTHEIKVMLTAPIHLYTHEFGHRLEQVLSGWLQESKKFIKHRARGRKRKQLTGHGKGVDGFDDEFRKSYYGRTYEDKSTELIGSGVEQMTRNAALFAKEDPEYFDFIYNLLKGRKQTYKVGRPRRLPKVKRKPGVPEVLAKPKPKLSTPKLNAEKAREKFIDFTNRTLLDIDKLDASELKKLIKELKGMKKNAHLLPEGMAKGVDRKLAEFNKALEKKRTVKVSKEKPKETVRGVLSPDDIDNLNLLDIDERIELSVKRLIGDAKSRGTSLSTKKAEEMVSAISQYSAAPIGGEVGDYLTIRSQLTRKAETGSKLVTGTKRAVENIDEFLKTSASFPSNKSLYRGLSLEDFQEDSIKFFSNLKPRNIIKDPSFSSWTSKKDVIEDFLDVGGIANVRVRMPKGTKHGTAIDSASEFPDQAEVLIKRDSRLKVKSIKKSTDSDGILNIDIVVEELP